MNTTKTNSGQTAYDQVQAQLLAEPKTWLVTGVAGFIGSHLLEKLLLLNQHVVGLDNFSTGYIHNLDDVRSLVSDEQWRRFKFIEGDIRHLEDCQQAVSGVDYVLHQAALGSVSRSLKDPIATNENNIDGFLNMLVASRDAHVKSFTYASSSSVYGDHPALPKVEGQIGKPLSPYAVTKYVNELYANVFARSYGFNSIGLRYFNVFGPRQDPNGSYAAVIPKWIHALKNGETVQINGDGETSRDFCYVANAVQANLLAATTSNPEVLNQVYNVAVGDRTTLNELFELMKKYFIDQGVNEIFNPEYGEFREGDVKHSQADINKISKLLSYQAQYNISFGIKQSLDWYLND